MPTKTAPQRQFDNALSVREIAKILGLSVDRARALVREGKIRAFQANRGAYRVFPADLLITGGSVSGFPAMVPFDAPCGALT
ncbi:MAG: helix-turn-helix domain-containing protein [Candidatus Riflebacteria bacterium]|nr:helix-turn-helix domain-containing protein [Candidatus Riflebacteria bacterium]